MKKILLTVFYFCLIFSNIFSQDISSLLKSNSLSETSDSKLNLTSVYEVNANVQTAMANPNYLVTAGDVYSLNFAAGTTPVSYTLAVDSTYKIRVANLGVIDVRNKSFLTVKKEIEDIVIRNYPMSGVQFVLLNPSIFTVVLTGEVVSTVEKKAWALTRLSDVISEDLTDFASIRNIEIKSSDGKVKTYDLFKALRYGELSQNPYMRPGDIIKINRFDRKITITGEIERPGTYELLPNETLYDLITKYGNGVTASADISKITISKIKTNDSVTGAIDYISLQSLEDDILKDYVLLNLDSVNINSYKDMKPSITVQGAILDLNLTSATAEENKSQIEVSNKIVYQFAVGESYSDFIRKNKNMFYSVSDLENAHILRGNEVISININEILYNVLYSDDLSLEANDVLVVPFRQFFVTVVGAVQTPGKFPYVPNRTYDYYIGLAGGFDEEKNDFSAVNIMDMAGNKKTKDDIILPEYTIKAKSNSFLYNFNQYAPVISTVLTLITTFFAVTALFN